ncbi:MAG: transcriptional regulator, TetR family [Micrococcaceae bacterium]|jgi:AcrR family transcriptional regulator|uniref:TetR/AcrR family transcriptional regulator n=1 Tax=Arthrobacter cheniae TaxID=1258888 RepID=A0A3A5M1V0_9MICC|nr:TetR/AcrR family transcriptional regulator [Arthrobacter cheniae]MCU1633754.1 transcriptional regulator, TetR family [Micrococcaceae bacterium]RJT75947.1 TetR/AcrR family transcriptional regulator [Arthrobacter cheniae]
MPRPRSALLSVELIVESALAQVDRTGNFSFPRIAAELGVSQSSLYNRIESREHIIELLRARIFADRRVMQDDDESWEQTVRRLIRSYHDCFAQHPNLVPLLMSQTVRAEAVLQMYEDLAAALERSGLPQQDLMSAISLIDYFALGSALESTAPDEVWDVSTEHHPTLRRALQEAGPTGERVNRAFDFGVDALLAGIAMRTKHRIY